MNINKDISKIALLCCSNGMGHCRRQYIQALEFQNNGYHVTLFGSLKKIHALELIYGKTIKRKVNFITFDYKNLDLPPDIYLSLNNIGNIFSILYKEKIKYIISSLPIDHFFLYTQLQKCLRLDHQLRKYFQLIDIQGNQNIL